MKRIQRLNRHPIADEMMDRYTPDMDEEESWEEYMKGERISFS